ncbi:hypothetical protein MT325_m182R [Paramecium bursaria chlorella virus MT325]|uniref:Uncharacterized protein m182R n=1 Tax=Paramecium bursaria Chlorella virus MT325 TaxID=346932 RepID=A7ITR2_PBCVM|nr:hypothetical protein MT325_m182R [Paramecium bursaria chlorella virus MT325]
MESYWSIYLFSKKSRYSTGMLSFRISIVQSSCPYLLNAFFNFIQPDDWRRCSAPRENTLLDVWPMYTFPLVKLIL